MGSLKEEYRKYKQLQEDAVDEAASKWINENVVFLTKNPDKDSVKNLLEKINKFESKIEPYRLILETVDAIIVSAEKDLENAVDGDFTSEAFEDFSLVYNELSDVFSNRVPAALSDERLDVARARPNEPMVSLDTDGNIFKAVSDRIKAARSKKEFSNGLVGRHCNLDYDSIARDMLGLTYSELGDASDVEVVPIVHAGEKPDSLKTKAEINESYLHEQVLLLEVNINELADTLAKLKSVTDRIDIPEIKNSVTNLQKDLVRAVSTDTGVFEKLKAAASKRDAKSIKNIFSSGPGKYIKQANMAIETFKKIGEQYPKVEAIVNSMPYFSTEEMKQVQEILSKNLTPSWFKKLSQSGTQGVMTKPYKGLDYQSIIMALSSTLKDLVSPEQLRQRKTLRGIGINVDDLNNPEQRKAKESKRNAEEFLKNYRLLYDFSKTGASASTSGVTGPESTTPSSSTFSTKTTEEPPQNPTTVGTEKTPGSLRSPEEFVRDNKEKEEKKSSIIDKAKNFLDNRKEKQEKKKQEEEEKKLEKAREKQRELEAGSKKKITSSEISSNDIGAVLDIAEKLGASPSSIKKVIRGLSNAGYKVIKAN